MIRYLRCGNTGLYDIKTGSYRASANGCFRAIVVREYEGQPGNPDYKSRFIFKIGEACEQIVTDRFKELGHTVEADVAVSEPITDTVHIMGHIDSIVDGVIYEQKSVQSPETYKHIIEKGIFKTENVAQLVQYMLIKEHTTGVLLYTSVGYLVKADKNRKGARPGDQRAFTVEIKDDGRIIVDNMVEAPFTAQEVLGHRIKAAEYIENKTICPDIPVTLGDPFFHVCGSCWLKPMCEQWDTDHDDNLFWKNVTNHLDTVGRRC